MPFSTEPAIQREGPRGFEGDEILRAFAPSMPVVDGCGAGATFSAGILYGYLRHWNLEDTAKFAIAAASLKCTVIGPRAFPLPQVKGLARQVRVEYLSL